MLYIIEGLKYEGIDCFIIKKELFYKFDLEYSIIGMGFVGLIIVNNFLYLVMKFIWIRDGKWIFYLGDDKFWLLDDVIEYF